MAPKTPKKTGAGTPTLAEPISSTTTTSNTSVPLPPAESKFTESSSSSSLSKGSSQAKASAEEAIYDGFRDASGRKLAYPLPKNLSQETVTNAESFLRLVILGLIAGAAIASRLFAVIRFESVIHEL